MGTASSSSSSGGSSSSSVNERSHKQKHSIEEGKVTVFFATFEKKNARESRPTKSLYHNALRAAGDSAPELAAWRQRGGAPVPANRRRIVTTGSLDERKCTRFAIHGTRNAIHGTKVSSSHTATIT
jgi:hypothetical protein